MGAAAATAGGAWSAERRDAQTLASQARTIEHLEAELQSLDDRAAPDWAAVAAQVEPSVVTISTDADLGSGWVAHSDSSGSDIVTNFHVVADAVAAGTKTVEVLQLDKVLSGIIVRTDRTDDLAVDHEQPGRGHAGRRLAARGRCLCPRDRGPARPTPPPT